MLQKKHHNKGPVEEIVMNYDIDIVIITRVMADGSHVSLGDSSSTVEQIVAALDAMTEGMEIIDDIFTHQTISVMNDMGKFLPKMPPLGNLPVKNMKRNEINFSNRFMVF